MSEKRELIRRFASGVEAMNGRLEAQIETAPTGAGTPGGLTEPLGGSAMTNRSQVRSNRRLIAIEFLQRAADDLNRATVTRVQYIAFARAHGASWRDIATPLGLTEAGARTLYYRKRHLLNEDAA